MKTYKLIRNLGNSRKPTEKSFAELVNMAKNHLNPRLLSIVHHFKFNSLFCQQGETTTERPRTEEFIEVLQIWRPIGKMPRDQLVCGMNDECIQRRLLAESQLEFKKAMELATAMETVDRNTHDLQNGIPSAHE